MTCIGVILYYVGTNQLGTEVNKAYKNQLDQSIQQMDDYLANLEHFVERAAFDQGFDDSLNQTDFIQEFPKTKEMLKSFSLMKESNPLINSVALYLRGAGILLGDEAGYREVHTIEDRKLFEDLLNKDRTIYWDYSLKKIDNPQSRNIAVVIKLPGGQSYNSFGLFLIYLDQAKLNQLAQKLAAGKGVAFLINENGDYLTSSDLSPHSDKPALQNAIRDLVLKEKLDEHTFTYDFNQESYAVSYGKISTFGGNWTVVSAVAKSEIVAPVTSLSRFIVWISAFGLLLGLLLSWIASNKIYDPIYRLKSLFETARNGRSDKGDEIVYIENQWKQQLQEQQALAARIKKSIPALRESFLLQLLQGNLYTYTEAEIIEKMKQLDWDIEHKRFVAIAAQLHGISELGEKYSAHDVQLVTFAASNIISELCSKQTEMVHVFNFQDLSVCAFFVLDKQEPGESTKSLLAGLADDFIDTLNDTLRMKVTVAISQISDCIVDMPTVLEQTRKALRFRDIHSSNQTLDMSDFMPEINRLTFPFELERGIVQAIGMGQEEEAVSLVEQFMLALKSCNSTELMVHQGMMKLLGTIHDALIKYDVSLHTLYDGVHLYEQLLHIHDPDEIVDWFQHKLIGPFIKALAIAYDSELRKTIERLLEQIREDVLKGVSLEMYAEQLRMSPSKLSKAFRQIAGTNFIDYIVRVRIEECKELLLSSDMKINDIAELLHYKPSHLIRIFKKNEGVTPGQYREKHGL
jgi:YesN/AraC family two-component response regulator